MTMFKIPTGVRITIYIIFHLNSDIVHCSLFGLYLMLCEQVFLMVVLSTLLQLASLISRQELYNLSFKIRFANTGKKCM